MRYQIILSPQAADDLRRLRAQLRSTVRASLEQYLGHVPTRVSKSRIKRLRGLARPQFRLRVGDIRVYYDVSENKVEVLAIIPKSEAETWLEQTGVSDEEGTTHGTEE
jgi:mRNA interferase RelE/StbE